MKKLDQAVKTALAEIGNISPIWSEEDQMYYFQHPLYPDVIFADEKAMLIEPGYKRILRDFLKDRLAGELADATEANTKGHGGRRDGAGRKKRDMPTKSIRLPIDIATWLSEPSHVDQVRQLIQA